jgi:hypothetical protein
VRARTDVELTAYGVRQFRQRIADRAAG